MRRVIWEDRNGYLRASLVRDTDPDEMAEQGVPVDLPSLDGINWEEVKRELNNELIRRGLFTWNDVMRSQNGVTASVNRIISRQLALLYKVQAQEVAND